jgi:L-fuculokinase
MPSGDIAIVFDCGATNVRVVAINTNGDILASESHPNNTQPDPFYPSYRIWDVNEIWNKMCLSCRKVISQINKNRICGVTATTFGVDGTLFSKKGEMLYPVISWQCERTNPVMARIEKYIPLNELYAEAGVLPFNFNTINKLIWLAEQKPELIERSDIFLFMPSILSYFLTGKMVNDITMAGTSMVTNLSSRSYSKNIRARTGFPFEKMGTPVEPGTITGRINPKAASETGLPVNTPVVATGHDTQFAVFGSGAKVNEPVLSSGTWEILMVRSADYKSGKEQLDMAITTEFDSSPGLFNIGNQWIASGMLEWAKRVLYPDVKENIYEVMINEASSVPAGSNGVKIVPKFFEELKGEPGGKILGLKMDTTREEIYHAMLEALAQRLKEGKEALEKAGGFRTDSILCVGGGSKNRIWNQLRANYAGIPVKVPERTETTVLGASFFVQSACNNFASPEEARSAVDYKVTIFEPNKI